MFVFVLLVIMILTLLAITIINVQGTGEERLYQELDGINRDKRVWSMPIRQTCAGSTVSRLQEESNSEAWQHEPSSSTSKEESNSEASGASNRQAAHPSQLATNVLNVTLVGKHLSSNYGSQHAIGNKKF